MTSLSLKVFPRDYKRVVLEKKAKEAAEVAAKKEEKELSKKDAFSELQKLANKSEGSSPSSNGATKVRFSTLPIAFRLIIVEE